MATTTYYPFQPSSVAPFSFQPTLDGDTYNATVTWSVFGQRWYLNIYALDGTLVVSEGLSASPTGLSLQSLSWARGRAYAMTIDPHGLNIGGLVGLTISGASPDAFNGLQSCLITGPSTFTYPLSPNPGQVTMTGAASYNVNLVGGYFTASTVVFRDQTQTFEVTS